MPFEKSKMEFKEISKGEAAEYEKLIKDIEEAETNLTHLKKDLSEMIKNVNSRWGSNIQMGKETYKIMVRGDTHFLRTVK